LDLRNSLRSPRKVKKTRKFCQRQSTHFDLTFVGARNSPDDGAAAAVALHSRAKRRSFISR
jgi:hypothetical protein